ncbi:MAG: FAD-dependent oxidoreductase [Alphaproteobacteria bacterium]|nr:FAD-dependent oxidoreductase [Alphaproteobacteria bacterium]
MKEFDIAVLGAGPAGCLTALLLRERGYDVAILSTPRARLTVEGLSDRVIEFLSTYECRNALAAVGPRVERLPIWNGESAARNRESVTERKAFDAGLLSDASARGVTAIAGRVGRIDMSDGDTVIGYRHSGGIARRLRCRFVVEARGRRAPHPHGRAQRGPETTALIRKMTGIPPRPETIVAALADGWVWYVSTGDGIGYLQFFLDGSAGALPKRPGLDAFFDARVAALGPAAGMVPLGDPAGQPMTRNATAWLAKELIGDRKIRVGDAAVAVDPLSGNGVFEAFGSALAAVAAVHTMLSGTGDAALAQAFYTERECEAFRRYCRVGRDFYRLETRWPKNPFWRARAAWPDDAPAHGGLRSAPPRVELNPVVENGLVVAREVCVTPDHPRGVWRIAGVAVIDLARFIVSQQGRSIADLTDRAAASLDADADGVAVALNWLRYRGILIDGPPHQIHLVGL